MGGSDGGVSQKRNVGGTAKNGANDKRSGEIKSETRQ